MKISRGNILVGGIDECTSDFMLLHSYLNRWKEPVNNLDLLSSAGHTVPSQVKDHAFFMLSDAPESEINAVSLKDPYFSYFGNNRYTLC